MASVATLVAPEAKLLLLKLTETLKLVTMLAKASVTRTEGGMFEKFVRFNPGITSPAVVWSGSATIEIMLALEATMVSVPRLVVML